MLGDCYQAENVQLGVRKLPGGVKNAFEQKYLRTESSRAAICCFVLLQVTCLDISSGGGLGVSTSTDGSMKIWQAANGEIRVRAGCGVLNPARAVTKIIQPWIWAGCSPPVLWGQQEFGFCLKSSRKCDILGVLWGVCWQTRLLQKELKPSRQRGESPGVKMRKGGWDLQPGC